MSISAKVLVSYDDNAEHSYPRSRKRLIKKTIKASAESYEMKDRQRCGRSFRLRDSEKAEIHDALGMSRGDWTALPNQWGNYFIKYHIRASILNIGNILTVIFFQNNKKLTQAV